MAGTTIFGKPTRRTRGGRVAVTTFALVTGGVVAVAPTQLASAEPEPVAQCQGQPVTIAATADGQTLEGTAGADVIDTAGFASVTVHGNDGDDLICVRNAAGARVDGGAGNDTIVDEYANPADDDADPTQSEPVQFVPETHDGTVLIGGPGDDTLTGTADTVVSYAAETTGVTIDLVAGKVTQGSGTDTVSGISRFVGTSYADTFVGGPGDDYFVGGPGTSPDGKRARDKISTGAGNDNVTAQFARVDLGDGDDHAWVHAGRTEGGAGNDHITVHQRGTVLGGPGDDVIVGVSDRSDVIGAGKFWLNGGEGDDRITPAVAFDAVGNLACAKGCTKSAVRGNAGTDWIIFEDAPAMRVNLRATKFRSANPWGRVTGVENIKGSAFDDRLLGNGAPNRIEAGPGRDLMRGRGGADVLLGGKGRDVAYGGPRKDVCRSVAVAYSC